MYTTVIKKKLTPNLRNKTITDLIGKFDYGELIFIANENEIHNSDDNEIDFEGDMKECIRDLSSYINS